MPTGIPEDLTGQRFGYWAVIRPVHRPGDRVVYECRCLCGYEAQVSRWSLVNGMSTRCRDCSDRLKREKWSAAKNNLVGRRFNDWLVVGYLGRTPMSRERLWLCRCICGSTGELSSHQLKKGLSKRCGDCVAMDLRAQRASDKLTWMHRLLGERIGSKPVDLTGQRFGAWTVLFLSGYAKASDRLWMCLCACGRTASVYQNQLQRGQSTRCRSCSSRQIAQQKKKKREETGT